MNKNFYHNKIILAINKKCSEKKNIYSEKKIKMPAAINYKCQVGGKKWQYTPNNDYLLYIYIKRE